MIFIRLSSASPPVGVNAPMMEKLEAWEKNWHQVTSEEQGQQFHTDDVSLPGSG